MRKFLSFLPGLWFWVIDKFDFSSTFTLRQTSTVDEFFLFSSVVRLQRRKQHKYDHYVNGEQQNRVSYTSLRASMTTSMCAGFAWKSLKILLITLSILDWNHKRINSTLKNLSQRCEATETFSAHIWVLRPLAPKAESIHFHHHHLVSLITKHTQEGNFHLSIHYRQGKVFRREFSLSDFEVSCFPPHTMLILLWHFYIENFPSTISDFSRHTAHISKVLEIVLHEKKKRTIIIFKNFPRKCRVSLQFGLKPQRISI